MNDSAKSALPSLVAKALAAELIRLPLLQTELALQSQDFLISFAYIMQRRSRRAFCGQNSSEIRRQKEDYSTLSISELRVLRHNLVPRVLRLFGQRGGARRDSGIMEKFNFFDWSSA